jgi:hypothetical protein
MSEDKNRMITVCAECKRSACWQGMFLCDESHDASTIDLPRWKLDELKLEHPSWYSDKEIDG